ncbi:MAG: HAMP domain-containing histidine kinase [Bacteroidales bacterium]|nr:HAMP domain-containing histidine kinase [Bacteroidales bacterium]
MWNADSLRHFKYGMIVVALAIAAASLFVSHRLTTELMHEERGKMEVWAEAMRSLTAADDKTDLTLVLKVINSNHTIPVIVTDAQGHTLAHRNLLPEPSGSDSLQILGEVLARLKQQGECMRMPLTPTSAAGASQPDVLYIYYEESVMLRRLSWYPYVQLAVVSLFGLLALLTLLAYKRAEQNRVWVGLSRETAHQLGTPISSLMAWSEVLRESYPDDALLPEMDKDIQRLQLIADRFNKIGSAPELETVDLRQVAERLVTYLRRRTSHKVHITFTDAPHPLPARVNAPLFEWVLENLCKNAVDAMQGEGSIHITLSATARGAHIEVSDTGKGIPRKHFKQVFKPGFTTKRRGWGLGLSLAKRIIEEYHHGTIYVKDSELGSGTTFAIDLH